ncbi:peptidoglycan -binding protein [Boseongicola aestuarii]|uniref:Putative lipoprotein YiaD n=1 Tax=Boseongicola aestuarii TaxID=1470561 RepID=A0A238IWV4_9RHOB|nr:peptidoglycan -binding protein [Boseongicola aestuarii]SMX22948.1 putative lipoprotein YiaD precursor [Boseongicola aestuarii]
MALTRRSSQRMSGSIWPGFVDAMTALLLVLMFVLTIFMVMQAVQRETITGQETELDQLAAEVTSLSIALGLSQQQTSRLEDDLTSLQSESDRQSVLISNLTGQLDQQAQALSERDAAIASFEAQVATLLSERDDARALGAELAADINDLEAARAVLISEQEALQLALAQARTEIDAQTEAARLAAARREALEALTADLRAEAETREASLSQALAALEAAEATEAALAEADARTASLTAELESAEAARLRELAAAEALRARLADAEGALSEEEQARLAEAAAAEALRERLENADAELTAMSLALEEQRQKAEDTLTLLAGANAVEAELNDRLAAALLELENREAELADREALAAEVANLRAASADTAAIRDQLAAALAARLAAENAATEILTEQERQAALLSTARQQLAEEEALSAQSQREVEALNQQVAALRSELGSLQALLDAAADADSEAQVRIEALGSQLNTALARAAQEAKRAAELEAAEAERLRIEAERLQNQVADLEDFRSEFFGTMRQVLGDREEVQIVGDRFVFSSEVLFESASATLSEEGQVQIARVANVLAEVATLIPSSIDWIIRVDGHTDNIPLGGSGEFADNWELSQGRALSVVKFMTEELGFPPDRLAATGFGEYRPVNADDTPEARAQNRRIELKLTER